jgi:hypothetical protein
MASTPDGYPYPVGTDKVVDGDNAIAALAAAIMPNGNPLAGNFLQPLQGPAIPLTKLRVFVVNQSFGTDAFGIAKVNVTGSITSLYAVLLHGINDQQDVGLVVYSTRLAALPSVGCMVFKRSAPTVSLPSTFCDLGGIIIGGVA